jgi:hypothetical protein
LGFDAEIVSIMVEMVGAVVVAEAAAADVISKVKGWLQQRPASGTAKSYRLSHLGGVGHRFGRRLC